MGERVMGMLLFLLIPLAGITYASWHVWCLLPLSLWWKVLAVVLLVGSFLLLFFDLGRTIDRMPLWLATPIYEVGTSSIIVLLYLVMLFLVLDLGRLLRLVPRSWLYSNWTSVAVIAVLMVGLFVYGNLHYRHKHREALTFTTAKPLAKPVKLVMMSDLHLGYHNRRAEFHRWVELINAEHPDAILIAGDIIDISVRPLIEERVVDEFRRLEAPVYACLGNHEYYAGDEQAQQFYREAGIQLLQDQAVNVGGLCVIGRDDRTNMRRLSVADLMRQADRSRFTILLDHQPYHLEKAEQQGVDFQFSGHTHHGQVWPISWITESVYECAFGSHQRGHTRYYVSSGLGIWGGKFRIGTRSEYVVAEIRPE